MHIIIERPREERQLRFKGSVRGLLVHLKINPETALVVRSGTLLTLDETLTDKDTVKILSVISGG